jgi:hypothetical protein
MVPLTRAVSGFSGIYKIIYKNSGNTMLSESINLEFNQKAMSFDSSSPAPISNSNVSIT